MTPVAPVALVAGASRGLGLLISAELVARGHRVHGCARDRDELDRAARLVNGGQVGPSEVAANVSARGEFV
jgi:NAD(P)-dependent dehydrogenase (short-subunit alcohol dehydrogenase family)